MTYSFVPCTDLTTRTLRWVPSTQNNGSRPASYVHAGVTAIAIAAQYAEAGAADVAPCPISGWRSVLWG